ncbi:MAG: hypothetical protein WBX14_05625, partial [Candidatus Udaeobacter sp.]
AIAYAKITEPAECAVCGIGAYRIERCRGYLRGAQRQYLKPLNLVFRLCGAVHEPLLAHSVMRLIAF